MKARSILLAAALTLFFPGTVLSLRAQNTHSISLSNRTNASGAAGSFMPSFSADGRFITLVSFANNLVTNDNSAPFLDIFVADLTNGQVTLVSGNLTGSGGGNGNSDAPAISANGQFIAFESTASDLAADDANRASDVFVRDTLAGTTTLISVHNSLGLWLYSGSRNPLISADGRWVFFESTAPDLVTNQSTGPTNNIYGRDRIAGTTLLISVDASGTVGGNSGSDLAGISADGELVAFVSAASNLVAGTSQPNQAEIYVRDVPAARTLLASTNMASILPGYIRSMNPVLTRVGQSVFFQSTANTATNLYRYDLQSNATTLVSSNVQNLAAPTVSADGRFVTYEKSNSVYLWDGESGTSILVSISPAGLTITNSIGSSQPILTPDGRKVLFLSSGETSPNGPVQLYVRDLQTAATLLVGATTNGQFSSDLSAILPAISSDGSLVAFDSPSEQLVADDLNQASDVFLRDLNTGVTQLISQHHPALPARTGAALCTLTPGALSADGRFAVFGSLDSDLVAGDTNGWQDVFVCDLLNGTNLPVSLGPSGLLTNRLNAHDPVISANGQFVAYWLGADQLFVLPPTGIYWRDLHNGLPQPVLPGHPNFSPSLSPDGRLVAFQTADAGHQFVAGISDNNGLSDVFARDMVAGSNQLISVNLAGTASGNRVSSNAVFSPDGRWVLFASASTDLVTNYTVGSLSLFVRDLLSNRTDLVSVGPDGSAQGGVLGKGAFSSDSRHVAFAANNFLPTYSIFIRDLQAGMTVQACADCANPSLSRNGRWVVFEAPISAGGRQIVLKDLQTGVTNLISINRAGTAGGNGDSTAPLISADGRFVVFSSKASDLADNDTNGVADIFARDRLQGTTVLVSLNRFGNAPGDALSGRAVLGADGRTVLFQSFATDLVTGDYNYTRDIFVLRLAANDTDNDGMDDDWEAAFFGDLSRDGSGDFDGDGMSDLQEFLAGTDPTNRGSILRVLTLSTLGTGRTVFWSAQPGKRYRVQFKDSLSAEDWTNLPEVITASSSTASASDTAAGSQNGRFYRVVLLP